MLAGSVAVLKLLPGLLLGVASSFSQPGILRPSSILAGVVVVAEGATASSARSCYHTRARRKQDQRPERLHGRETSSELYARVERTKKMKEKRSLTMESTTNARQKSSNLATMSYSPRRADAVSLSKSCDRNDISTCVSIEGRMTMKERISYLQASGSLRGRRRRRVLESRLEPAGT